MALTNSASFATGVSLPPFALPDVTTGGTVTPKDFVGSPTLVVIFLCRHCPYVVHVLPEVLRLAADYLPRGTALVGISSNDAASYPDDSPENLAKMVSERGIPFPILHDASQETARAFGAACTPEFYLYDAARTLRYHGRLDASTPGNGLASDGSDLRRALDALAAGAPVAEPQHPSMGCNIKWK
jgi:peroxiredoxin